MIFRIIAIVYDNFDELFSCNTRIELVQFSSFVNSQNIIGRDRAHLINAYF